MSPFLYGKSFHLETKRREECFPLSPETPVPDLKFKCNVRLMTDGSLLAYLWKIIDQVQVSSSPVILSLIKISFKRTLNFLTLPPPGFELKSSGLCSYKPGTGGAAAFPWEESKALPEGPTKPQILFLLAAHSQKDLALGSSSFPNCGEMI